MSSHHIVRDEQEPALILHRMLPHQWPSILQLLEWSPTVIACEDVIEKMLSLGHKVDIAIVEKEQIEFWQDRLQVQSPVKILAVTPESSQVDIALNCLKEKNHRAVNVITDNENIWSVLSIAMPYLSSLNIVLFSEDHQHAIIKSMVYKKWLPAFSSLTLMPIKTSSYASTEGFNLNLEHELLSEGIILEKKMEGEVKIKVSNVPYVISEGL